MEGDRGEMGRGKGWRGKLSVRVTVRGGRIRGIAPKVLTAKIQNQSVKTMGKGNLVL